MLVSMRISISGRQQQLDSYTLLGFAVPIMLAVAIGLVVHAAARPIAAPVHQETNASGAVTETTPVNQPTAAEIAAANQAILGYCSSDLRQDTSCSLISNSSMTAPGFVETGLQMHGNFAADGSSSQGLALAKGSGTDWAVIWVGQGCIPRDTATQNGVPTSLNICSS